MKVCFTHAHWGAWNPEELVEQEKLAEIAIKSVRKVMPHAQIVQITNPETKALDVDVVSRLPLNGMFFCDWAMEHWSRIDGEVIFLDTDVVVQKDLSVLFSKIDFEVLMTLREKSVVIVEERKMPVNIGVVWSRSPSFWQEMSQRIRKMPDPRDRSWWGAQVTAYEIHKERSYKFFALPMDPYNYSPKTEEEDVSDKWVVHYKGRTRKKWMLARQSA